MCLEANHDLTHSEIIDIVFRQIKRVADSYGQEVKLPNGKIADIWYTVLGTEFIIEAKTYLKASLLENAYQKYATQCDYLIIAAPPGPLVVEHLKWGALFPLEGIKKIGIWRVSWAGIRQEIPPGRMR